MFKTNLLTSIVSILGAAALLAVIYDYSQNIAFMSTGLNLIFTLILLLVILYGIFFSRKKYGALPKPKETQPENASFKDITRF